MMGLSHHTSGTSACTWYSNTDTSIGITTITTTHQLPRHSHLYACCLTTVGVRALLPVPSNSCRLDGGSIAPVKTHV